MTHTKFIELLNLYVDHQISAEEAGLLESEIRHNPARLELYRQYCRMQKGCSLLADTFREQVPEPQVTRGNVSTHSSRRLIAWTSGLGTMAAAACVALVLLNRAPAPIDSPASQPTAPAIAQTNADASVRPMLSLPTLPRSHQQLQTVFAPTSLVAANPLPQSNDASLLTSEDLDRLDWLNHVQVEPVQFDDYTFRVRPTVPTELQRTYSSSRPFQGSVEMTAFEFQR